MATHTCIQCPHTPYSSFPGLGFGVGKAMDQSAAVDRDQIALSNGRIFLPVDATSACMNCHVSFSLFHHAHHCRLCGCVCCSKCLREEGVQYPHVVDPVKCRVCVDCVSANAPFAVGSRHPCPVHRIVDGQRDVELRNVPLIGEAETRKDEG